MHELEHVKDQEKIQRKPSNDRAGDNKPPLPAAGGGLHSQQACKQRAGKADRCTPLPIRRDEDAGKKNGAGNSGFCISLHAIPPTTRVRDQSAAIGNSFNRFGRHQACRNKSKRNSHNYFWRDFAFTLAITAKGETTVTRTRAKTITKPNMIFLAFFGFKRRTAQGLRSARPITITRRRLVIPRRLQIAKSRTIFVTSSRFQ